MKKKRLKCQNPPRLLKGQKQIIKKLMDSHRGGKK